MKHTRYRLVFFIAIFLLLGFSVVGLVADPQESEPSIVAQNYAVVEQVDLRTETSKTFAYTDGSGGYAIVYMNPIHVLNTNGQWIDKNLLNPDDTVTRSVVQDAYAQSAFPTIPPGNQFNLYVGYDTLNGANNKGVTRLYVQFNNPALPAGATITSGIVKLYQYVSVGSTFNLRACRIAQSWGEYTLTWNMQPSVTDCLGYMSVSATNNVYKNIDITGYVQTWQNNPSSNYGIRLNAQNETSNGGERVFYSRDCITQCSNGTLRPYLEIVYTLPSPTPTPTPTGMPTSTPTPTRTPTPTMTPSACVVPFYSQRDPRWINHPLRTVPNGCSVSCNTIGRCGCTLTSAAMLFKHFGANLNPATLSDCMGNYACPFYWGVGANCSGGNANYVGSYTFSWNRLQIELNQNRRPVLIELIRYVNGVLNTHWVLALSGSGTNPSNYIIHDPWPLDGANDRLSNYNNWILNRIVVYSDPSSCGTFVGETIPALSVRPQPVWGAFHGEQMGGQTMISTQLASTLQGSPVVTGTVTLYARTEITMTVQLTASSTEGEIVDMLVWTDSMPNTTWQPYAAHVYLPVSEEIYARFRDSNGNISTKVMDTLYPRAAESLGINQMYLPLLVKP